MQSSFSKTIFIPRETEFDPAKTFDCGQAFRFHSAERDGINGFEGIAENTFIRIEEDTDGCRVSFTSNDTEKAEKMINRLLDLSNDYALIKKDILSHSSSNSSVYSIMEEAMTNGTGIRILRQDPWETAVTFITSINNNIPRIRKLTEAVSAAYGEPIRTPYGDTVYSFPTPEKLLEAGESGLSALKYGFRARYIYELTKNVISGSLDLDGINLLPTSDARKKLMETKGIGKKVADCVLLFAYGRMESFPIDVWMKRVIEQYFGGEVPDFGNYAGLAQQYLFFNERYTKSNNNSF